MSKLWPAGFSLLLFTACSSSDPSGSDSGPQIGDSQPRIDAGDGGAGDLDRTDLGAPSSRTLRGQVLSPSVSSTVAAFDAVGGARVWIAGGTATVADSRGFFVLNGVASEGRVLVNVAGPDVRIKSGRTTRFGTTQIVVQGEEPLLFPKIPVLCTYRVPADTGDSFDLARCGSGGSVAMQIPAGVLARMDGSAFDGTAELSIGVTDPLQGSTFAVAPGQIMGDADPEPEIYAVAEFHVADAAGKDLLRIAPGGMVTFRVPVDVPSDVDSQILRWQWLDEASGAWITEGSGTLSADRRSFTYQTTHFSTGRLIGTVIQPAGCLRITAAKLESPRLSCTTAADCPIGPDGRERPCNNGFCGCANSLQCDVDSICDQGTCQVRTCSASNACGSGLDQRPLICLGNRCGCSSDFQCSGDQKCFEGRCVQKNVSADVFVDNRFYRTFTDVGSCWPIKAGGVDVVARYINPFSSVASQGRLPSYEWRPLGRLLGAGPVMNPQTCPAGCLIFGSPDPIVLTAHQRSCVSGTLVTSCGPGCFQPVRGSFEIRENQSIQTIGFASPQGEFCAPIDLPRSASRVEITQGRDYPVSNYLFRPLTPQGTPGATCPALGSPNFPVGQCEDLGVFELGCSGECMDARFEYRVSMTSTSTYLLELDARSSRGPIAYYEYEIYDGAFRVGAPRFVTRTSRDPRTSISLPTGAYTVLLTTSNDRRWQWSYSSQTILIGELDMVSIQKPDPRQDIICPFGCTETQIGPCSPNNTPPIAILMRPFAVDRHEVTQGEYAACIGAGACAEPPVSCTAWDPAARPRHPAVCVSWNEADSYCRWRSKRLLTEFEWECAARPDLSWWYPNGYSVSCNEANVNGCESSTEPVGSWPAGASFGIEELIGNASEWTANAYDEDLHENLALNPRADQRFLDELGFAAGVYYPVGPTTGAERTVRGGSFRDSRTYSWWRGSAPTAARSDEIGFRCGRDIFGAPSGSACTTGTTCDSRRCVANRCVADGELWLTLTWTGDTDLDLHVQTPRSGFELAPDQPRGGSGLFDVEDCRADRCNRPGAEHVENVAFGSSVGMSPAETGTYRLWVENRTGTGPASYRIESKTGLVFQGVLPAAPQISSIYLVTYPLPGPPTACFNWGSSGGNRASFLSCSRATAPSTIANYEWDWEGNGVYDYSPGTDFGIAEHTYPAPGNYTVQMRVTDSNGLTDTTTRAVTVQ